MPFKSEAQRRYLWANEPEIARDWTDTYGSRIQKSNGGIMSMQGGVKNYLGEQPMVSAPKYWQSAPDHEMTELAYITPRERDVLVNMDMYGSMNGSPNEGPSGIMSLNGWGDKGDEGFADKSFGGADRYDGGASFKGGQTGADLGFMGTTGTGSNVDVVDQKYSGDGFFSGYRNLDDQGQPLMGLAYLGDRLKSFVPSMIGNLIAPGLGTAFTIAKNIPNIKNFRKYNTLSNFYRGELNPPPNVEEEFTDGYEIGPSGQYRFVTAAEKKERDALIK